MKKLVCFCLVVMLGLCLISCGKMLPSSLGEENLPTDGESFETEGEFSETGEEAYESKAASFGTEARAETSEEAVPEEKELISPVGMTVESRILPPDGYERISVEDGSFGEFLREYPLKEDGSPVLLYNGRKKGNQNAHVAVLKLPLEGEDLQQCADSVLRIYAEYFWQTGQYERIRFHFVSGFLAEYEKWREGYRISVSGNAVEWVKTADYDDSYETFAAYLRMVFAYASTLSMEAESDAIALAEISQGDVFLKGGSPGHVVMVLDVCENADGKKAFLLGQGYMPAQEFHVLKNSAHPKDPWYYEEEVTYPFQTPEYTFSEGSLRRVCY